MATVEDIVKAFGGPAEFGRACGFERNPASRGSDILHRGSIPSGYWKRLVEIATDKGIDVTLEQLATAHATPPAAKVA